MLGREKVLLREMFERRKSMAFRASLALEIVEYKRERVRFLIDHGVIHANGDFLELEDVYVKFFEEVLDMNEEISVASVKEYIDSLKENINYWLEETNEQRRFVYMGNVRKILRRIGLRTLKKFYRTAIIAIIMFYVLQVLFFHDLAFCPVFVKILKKGMINQ